MTVDPMANCLPGIWQTVCHRVGQIVTKYTIYQYPEIGNLTLELPLSYNKWQISTDLLDDMH